jgi:hypothetical protein
MSKATREFFEGLKDMVGDGINNLIPDVAAELYRLGTHGAVELGQALFNGAAFTPYGPGAYTREAKEVGMTMDGVQSAEIGVHGKDEPQQDHGGREM